MKYLAVPIYMPEDSEGAIPTVAYEDDAGHDLYASETVTILPRSCEGVALSFSTAIPQGYFAKIESRSGLAKNCAISVVGGIIDSNFRGEWQALLLNSGVLPYTVKPGDKVAQVVFHKKQNVRFERVEKHSDLGNTNRGKRGFGSSDSKVIDEKKPKSDEDEKKTKSEDENDKFKLNHFDPNHPLYCGSQPPPTDYSTPDEESEDDCQITSVSGEMRNEKGDLIAKY